MISIVIPTYGREQVLIETLSHLLDMQPAAAEIIVVDQTAEHEPATAEALSVMSGNGKIRWIRLPKPSITHAMNVGLLESCHDIVLFLDDDVIPCSDLAAAHVQAHRDGHGIVAGQVLQPGKEPLPEESGPCPFRFNSSIKQHITELMGGNFSVNRTLAIELGGFDENFVQAAYRFEAEFSDRASTAGEKILFEPRASIRHLRASQGGIRSYGEHLTTVRPGHSVGAYYYLLRSPLVRRRWLKIPGRTMRAVRTRHHMTRPWWIPVTLLAELLGLAWAVNLRVRGPRLIASRRKEDTP